MTSFRSLIGAAALFWAANTSPCVAVSDPGLDDQAIDEVVDHLIGALRDQYPLSDVAETYQRALTRELRRGAYRGMPSCDLAAHLAADLQKAHRDRHLTVLCGRAAANHSLTEDKLGHGLQSVTLEPRLSLAAITMPGPWEIEDASFEAVSHAMALAADADNVVLDLRGHPGGHGEIGYFIASYFLPPGETRVFERGLYHPPRPPEITRTLPYVPGRHLSDARLFILINAHTASAAEGFAFGMQQLHRATIVGQTSAGAGIAGHDLDLGHGISMFLPFKLIVAPDSDASYEGKGVVPDRATEPDKEYDAVIEMIREETIKRDRPMITRAAEPAAVEPPPPTDDPTPHLENCQLRQIAEDGHSLSQTNRCGRPVTVQYDNGDLPDEIYEQILAPGDRMDIHLPARTWWIMAACPQGYYSTVPVGAENREAIANSRYACTRTPGTDR